MGVYENVTYEFLSMSHNLQSHVYHVLCTYTDMGLYIKKQTNVCPSSVQCNKRVCLTVKCWMCHECDRLSVCLCTAITMKCILFQIECTKINKSVYKILVSV